MKFTNEDRRAADDFLLDEIEHTCKMLEQSGYTVPDNIMADDWTDFVDGIRYGVDFIIESTETLIEILKKFDSNKFSREIQMLNNRMEQWLKVHDEYLREGKMDISNFIRKVVGVLYDMDNFIMSVYDNEYWLTYGVPDGEFEERNRKEAEANYKEHEWLVTDGDLFEGDDFIDFINAFKSATSNKRDYDPDERAKIIEEAESLLSETQTQTLTDDTVAENTEENGEIIMESPKYLTKEQVNEYLKKAKLNEQLMMEGPFDGLKQKIKDAHRAKDIKNSNKDGNVQRIIRDAKDPEVSSTYTFIVNGKELPFNRAKGLSDEELANAIVIDRFGYYIRRGLQNVEKKHEFRHSSSQDWVKDEYKYGSQKPADNSEDDNKKKGSGTPTDGEDGGETPANLPDMKGDYRDWTYRLKDGRAVNWSDLQKIIKNKEIDQSEHKDIQVFDKKKKKFTWEEANKVIDAQMSQSEKDRADRDQKIKDKEAAKADAAAQKAQNKDDRAAIKKTRGAEKTQKPVGRLKFFDKDGKEIGERQYKKLTTDQKKQYIAKDRKGNEFTYDDLLMHRKAQKRLNASLENDPNKDILESLDWDTVGNNLNESLHRNHRDDTFTESYARTKEDVEYDDDASSLNYLI